MKINLNEKRFLIIWTLVQCFALFVNVAGVEGNFLNTTNSFDPTLTTVSYENFFTTTDYKGGFWPFTTYTEIIPKLTEYSREKFMFYGIFNSYNWAEFMFYIILGVAIIYLPKIWNEDVKKIV